MGEQREMGGQVLPLEDRLEPTLSGPMGLSAAGHPARLPGNGSKHRSSLEALEFTALLLITHSKS